MAVKLKKLMKRLKADTIREDGRLERTCKHGVGHTVGHVSGNIQPEGHSKLLNMDWFWVHGCCGCCKEWVKQEINDVKNV